MHDAAGPTVLHPTPWRSLAAVLAMQAIVLTALSSRYGYHRDELYFRVAGGHLAWGYVDQPPLTVVLGRLSILAFGDTVAGMRAVATMLALSATVLCALIARELGAGRTSQLLAAFLAMSGGYTLAVSHMLSTSTSDLVIWLAIVWVTLRLLRTRDARWFVVVGALAGLGVLNKFLVVLLLIALVAGLIIAGPRRLLASRWLAVGVVVAAVVMSPTLIWQASHGWPQLTVARGIGSDDGVENRLMLLPNHALLVGPVLVPVWLVGLVRLVRSPAITWARPVGMAYLVALVAVLATGGKFYYVLPLLLVALAAGVEPVLDWLRDRRWARAAAALVGLGLVINALIALPLVPPSALDVPNSINGEQGAQIGWQSFVQQVSDVWQQIPADQRGRAVVFTGNYGEAGAIDRYGSALGLPPAYSGHMSFHAWGPPPDTQNGPLLFVHTASASPLASFTRCRVLRTIELGLDTREQHAVVELCGGTTAPWSTIWPALQKYS